MRRYPAAFGVALLLAACGGGGGGSSPSTLTSPASTPASALPAGATLSFVSGETESPVGGARVEIGEASYVTDETGQMILGGTVSPSVQMTILADNFLDRRAVLRPSSERSFTLLAPDESRGLDESWTQELVYTNSTYCCPVNAAIRLGELPLIRARSGISIRRTPSSRGSTSR